MMTAKSCHASTLQVHRSFRGELSLAGVAGDRIWLRGYSCQVPSQRKQGRRSDVGSELGQAPCYQLKQSPFKSHFKGTPCRFRDLTLHNGELAQYLLDRAILRISQVTVALLAQPCCCCLLDTHRTWRNKTCYFLWPCPCPGKLIEGKTSLTYLLHFINSN